MGSHMLSPCIAFSLMLFAMVVSHCSSSPTDNPRHLSSVQNFQKVDLTLYYESLCPACTEFISHSFLDVITEHLMPIVNLKLVPWGNARLFSDGSFACQHGPDECFLNTVEACIINFHPRPSRQLRIIHCIEALVQQGQYHQWASCLGDSYAPVLDCYNSGLGKTLEQQYGVETLQLIPPHRYTPWVVVNGQPLEENYGQFIAYVCKAYKGPSPPAVCKSATAMKELASDIEKVHEVCYASDRRT
ncbi:Gamma interferon inducible lysosomal thiol reductase GILT [Dillenia turbinata]|uniref:Gamma interferon inducible lysosomal thiol reductase GILT n=1 Tax=Dillenia turbinata TaxID=194707 RepID=A0AAN8W8A8_9MAGN